MKVHFLLVTLKLPWINFLKFEICPRLLHFTLLLEGFFFQKGPPPLDLRYSNLLSEIRELFATWAPSRRIPEFSSEKFSDLKLDSWPDSEQYDMDIQNTTHLRPFTCWKSSQQRQKNHLIINYDVVVLTIIFHRILYSFCRICNITMCKSIRKTCSEFYLS